MEGDCPATDDDSEIESDNEAVWVKSARGTWGLGNTFWEKLDPTGTSKRKAGSLRLVPRPTPKCANQPKVKPPCSQLAHSCH